MFKSILMFCFGLSSVLAIGSFIQDDWKLGIFLVVLAVISFIMYHRAPE